MGIHPARMVVSAMYEGATQVGVLRDLAKEDNVLQFPKPRVAKTANSLLWVREWPESAMDRTSFESFDSWDGFPQL